MTKIRKVKPIKESAYPSKDLKNVTEYRHFIKIALKYADCICLSYTDGLKDFYESEWSFLAKSIIEHEYTNKSPVTIGPTVLLLYLEINNVTKQWLWNKMHIFDFISHDIESSESLEDFCLIKDKELIFCSCTHEEFYFADKKLAELIERK